MATNEIFKDANYLSLPVPEGTVSGDPVLVGELVGVAQTTEGENYGTSGPFTPPVWGTVPPSTGFNEAGYASVALVGAFAFEIEVLAGLRAAATAHQGTPGAIVVFFQQKDFRPPARAYRRPSPRNSPRPVSGHQGAGRRGAVALRGPRRRE